MKKIFTILTIAIALSFSVNAQEKKEHEKKDTTISVQMSLSDFRIVLSTIDQNIDSKKISSGLLEFLQKNASIVADKPKETIKK